MSVLNLGGSENGHDPEDHGTSKHTATVPNIAGGKNWTPPQDTGHGRTVFNLGGNDSSTGHPFDQNSHLVGRLYTIPELLEPERVTIETKEEFPKYNPGEMVLRLTRDAIVTPTVQNPMGLQPAVIQFLAMLCKNYDFW